MQIVILSLLFAVCAFGQLDVSIGLVGKNPLTINFTVSNPSQNDVTFCQWGTPFEGVWTDMFEIRDEKFNQLDYVGMIVRRGPVPIDSEYITISAGDMKTVIVDLGVNYDFKSVGKYMVRVNLPLYSELLYAPNDAQVEVFDIETIPAKRQVDAPQGFTNCNANQVSQANSAIDSSISACSRSVSCLNTGCDSLYATWFGAYSDSNWNYVSTCYRNVYNRLNNYAFNGHCNPAGCGTNVYGYVYPTDSSYTVYLCNLFWTIPKERINTIIHEMSHFSNLAGTQDYEYGETACKALAKSSPQRATRNADNICYFAGYV
jgi:peptidyl-Lys metalloendopeptidase